MAKKNRDRNKPIPKYMDLLYMTSAEIRAKDLADVFRQNTELGVELWDEMNVLELNLPSTNSVDFEPFEVSFSDPSDAAFAKNRNIHTIFTIHMIEEDFRIVIPFLEQVQGVFGGFVCADTEDFKPVYVGSSNIE